MNEKYLWDRSGERDPEIAQLEDALAPLRLRERHPKFTAPRKATFLERVKAGSQLDLGTAVALVASIAFIATLVFLLRHSATPPASLWDAQTTAGAPDLGGKVLQRAYLAPGVWLTTGNNTSVHIEAKDIGEVEIGANSQVSLVEATPEQQRLSLRYGNMHARIYALPGLFVVDTPSARAIDLGCEYTLNVDREGRGELRVSSGWVSLNSNSPQALVPAGAVAKIAAGGALTAPYFEDSSFAFQQAVVDFSFISDASLRHPALIILLHDGRQRDAFTLLNLFPRANESERLEVFDRLNRLVPAPPGITRETARNWQVNSMDAWWPVVHQALGLTEIKKGKKYPEKPGK